MTTSDPTQQSSSGFESAVVIASGAAQGLGAELIAHVGRRLSLGSLALVLPGGGSLVLRGRLPGPEARMEIHSWRALARVALRQGVGLADGYAAGEWDSPDPAAVVELAACNFDRGVSGPSLGWLVRPWRALRHALNANSHRRARRNIAFHYDRGNDFYAQWLDSGMTYSSALFSRPGMTLAEAQDAKCRRILASLGSRPGQHLLEIGCGWGGLAEMAARDFGLKVTALTLSRAQLDYARARIARAGLADRVDVRFCDYRDVAGSFDHIVSVEMLEAVGEAYWPLYFRRVAELLAPGGRAAIQVITIDEALFPRYRSHPDFIQRQVFPGGMLPTGAVVRQQGETAGLRLRDDFRFGLHYARTLAEWRRRFQGAGAGLAALGLDAEFRRRWNFYLAYCEGGFRAGRIDVRQMLFQKPAESPPHNLPENPEFVS